MLREAWKRPSKHDVKGRCQSRFPKCSPSPPGVLPEVLGLLVLTYPLLWGLALQLHSAVTGTYVPGTNSIAFVSCLNEQIARDIARAIMDKRLAAYVNILPQSSALYFWKGELEESTEILLVSDRSLHHKYPCCKRPQLKGAAGRFGEGGTNLLGLGASPGEGLLSHPWPCWEGTLELHIHIPPSLHISLGLWFGFLLSTAGENKDVQNRGIVQLRQVRLWLHRSTGCPIQGRLSPPAPALGLP
uniref:CutA divalent cation tolerance homolog n=1 Tax=Taeniopygia guttata TaxID=59729 RepID=A0A674HAY7_TAEGU